MRAALVRKLPGGSLPELVCTSYRHSAWIGICHPDAGPYTALASVVRGRVTGRKRVLFPLVD